MWVMIFKKIRNFGGWKLNLFVRKPNRENFGRSQRNFSEIGGILKQGGSASLPQRDGRPWF